LCARSPRECRCVKVILARLLIFVSILLIFIASQLFWFLRVREWGRRLLPNKTLRKRLGWAGLLLFLLIFIYNLDFFSRPGAATHMTLKAALFEAPFKWWFFGSLVGFVTAIPFWGLDRMLRLIHSSRRKPPRGVGSAHSAAEDSGAVAFPARRRFLEQTAMVVASVPFAAGAYGMLYERVDVETTHQRVKLRRLPKAFDGFRIAQLSDIHIGPFMSEEEIRRIVGLANKVKPDLMVLTGDFVTWDPSTQVPVVRALAGLKAPFGIYGCVGNHEAWSHTEDSITALFAAEGIKILRQERVAISSQNEAFNLIGVDFQTKTRLRNRPGRGEHFVRKYLSGVEKLIAPETANVLLSHNPNTFDRAAELGIELSLAGHTHGGQVSLEFVNQNISPSRLITSYVKGWFQKAGAQLYVNRGIGTIGIPIRIGSPPEITVFELTRET